jgi:cell wall-associated NlpC family hydrolase
VARGVQRICAAAAVLLSALLMFLLLPTAAQADTRYPVLRQGSRGTAVVTLQRDLRIPADGVYGRQTKRYVISFQRSRHLTGDGIVGARTWQALARLSPNYTHVVSPAVPATPLGINAANLAAAQRGKPYLWGAAGPSRFDCSGLVQYVYRQLGVNIARTTWTQYASLRHVSRASIRVGDLVFLDNLNHVGIYAGWGLMWNAPHTGSYVKLSKIWDSRYLVARVG